LPVLAGPEGGRGHFETVVVVHAVGYWTSETCSLVPERQRQESMVAPDLSNVTGTVGKGDIWSLYRRGGVLGKG
jgi:hypothetical protein